MASCFPACWEATGMLGYFETSAFRGERLPLSYKQTDVGPVCIIFKLFMSDEILYICLSLKRKCQEGDDAPTVKI